MTQYVKNVYKVVKCA